MKTRLHNSLCKNHDRHYLINARIIYNGIPLPKGMLILDGKYLPAFLRYHSKDNSLESNWTESYYTRNAAAIDLDKKIYLPQSLGGVYCDDQFLEMAEDEN